MPQNLPPLWITNLEDEDIAFIKRFILSSGSLKEMAKVYHVTYPTVRLRLDRLIEKIRLSESEEQDSYVAFIKRMALDDRFDADTAKLLISAYRKQGGGQ